MAGPGLSTSRTGGSTGHISDTNTVHGIINKFDKDAVPVSGDMLRWDGTIYVPSSAGRIVYVESYRAVSVTDNATIAAACAALTSNSVLRFESGRTYTLTSAITATLAGLNNITFDFTGSVVSAPSIIGSVIILQGSYPGNITTATVSIANRSTTITVANASGLAAGNIINIRSSGEVFNPDRVTAYTKGELARIESVVGNVLTLSSPTRDSYSISGHTVNIGGPYNPVTNLRVVGLSIAGGGATKNQTGLLVQYFDGCMVRDTSMTDVERVGIYGSYGYDFKALGVRVTRTNEAALGYGLKAGSVDGVTFGFIKGRENRHTIDIDIGDGVQVPARNIVLFDVNAEDDLASGISTHGGCEDVKIISSTVKDCGGGLILRGKKNLLSHVTILGSKSPAQSSGSYVHGIYLGDDTPHTWGVGLAGTDLAIEHCYIDIANPLWATEAIDSWGIYSTASLSNARITNNTFKGFSSHGMYLKGDTNRDVRIADNDIDCSSQVGTFGTTNHVGIRIEHGHATTGNNSQRIQIRDNRITSPMHSGIRVVGNVDSAARSDDIDILDNTVNNYGDRGVDLNSGFYGSAIRVRGNRFPHSASAITNAVRWTPGNFVQPAAISDTMVGATPTVEYYTTTTTRQLTASHNLAVSDSGQIVEINSASATTITVQPNSSAAIPIGTTIRLRRYGAGTVTVVAGGGVTIRSQGGLLAISAQYAEAALTKRATDEWVLIGDLA